LFCHTVHYCSARRMASGRANIAAVAGTARFAMWQSKT
jgi:hypothetical protein